MRIIATVRKLTASAAASALALAALTGCSSDTPPDAPLAETSAGPTPTAPETATSPQASADQPTGATTARDVDLADHTFVTSPQHAIDLGTKEAGEGIVHAIEVDWSNRYNAWLYEVEILINGVDHEVYVDADTSEIIKHEQDRTRDTKEAIDLTSPMTWEKGRDLALAKLPGRITSWSLEWEDGRRHFDFDILAPGTSRSTEVVVDVETGQASVH